jgi:hypothetical protein
VPKLFRWPADREMLPRKHINPVLRVERGDGSRVVPVDRLVKLHSQHTNLLRYLRIERVFLLGEYRHGKADCESCYRKPAQQSRLPALLGQLPSAFSFFSPGI